MGALRNGLLAALAIVAVGGAASTFKEPGADARGVYSGGKMTDFTELTDDELADAGHALVGEIHARIDALPETAANQRKRKLVKVLHGAADALRQECADDELIQPMSGGGPKG